MGKTVTDNDPVFIQKLHHIADRGKGRQLQKAVQESFFRFQKPKLPVQAQNQLIGDHRSANPLEGTGIPLLLRIHHHISRRKAPDPLPVLLLIGNLMMIRHDDGHALFLRKSDFRPRRNPVVAGKDRINSRLISVQNQMFIQSVAVLHPVRNRRVRIRSRFLQSLMQDAGSADSICVIIADHADLFPFPDFCSQKRCRLFHAKKRFRRIHIIHRSIQKFPEFLVPRKPPVSQDSRRHRADAELLRYFIKIRLLGGNKPFCHIYLHAEAVR